MSQDGKFFVKPKVRFSQSSENKHKTRDSKNLSEQKAVERSKGPKIRSIVSLEKPVKIINLDVAPGVSKTVDNLQNTPPTECNDALPCSLASAAPSACNNLAKETHRSSLSNDNIKDVRKNHKKTIVSHTSLNDNANTVSSLPSEIQQDLTKVLKPRNNVKMNISETCRKNKLGKENENAAVNTESKKEEAESFKIHRKAKPSISSTSSKSLHLPIKSCKTVPARKPSAKSAVHVMPCHKYNRVPSKVKTSPVRKTVIRDVVSRKVKPYIGPGLSHEAPDIFELPKAKEDTHRKLDNSGEKLARPEYNSIVCTINKLKELKKQKIVTDIEHLPTTYKNLVNGKISTALDYPLDEMIYQNLVDLSVDEKQLPSRLMRSKDPEPRQRDIVPLLSDFFTPVSSEEYCTPVSFKSRAPENVENWNAFRISDKILEWKHKMDHL